MKPFADRIGAQGMLAVASSVVVHLIALQDQRTMSPERALNIVAQNIQLANEEAIRELLDAKSAGRA